MRYTYETNIGNFKKYFERIAWLTSFCQISMDFDRNSSPLLWSWETRQLVYFSLDSKILSDPKTLGPNAATHELLSRDRFSVARNRASKWEEIGHATKKELSSASRNGSDSIGLCAKSSFLDRKHVQNGTITPTPSINLEINGNNFEWNVMGISRYIYW